MKKIDDSFIVRIYRRAKRAEGVDASVLIGMVEDPVSGTQQAFHTVQELWRILARKAPGNDLSSR